MTSLNEEWFLATDDNRDAELSHLSDQEIRALVDSYDDPRISILVEAFILLRTR